MQDFHTFQMAMVALRLRRRWSQQKAGRAAGLDHSTVSRWEGGTREPTRDNLSSYLAAMGASEAEQLLIMNTFGGVGKVDARAQTIVEVMNDERIAHEHRSSLEQILEVGVTYARAAQESFLGYGAPSGHSTHALGESR